MFSACGLFHLLVLIHCLLGSSWAPAPASRAVVRNLHDCNRVLQVDWDELSLSFLFLAFHNVTIRRANLQKKANTCRWGFVFLIPISSLNVTPTSGICAMCILCQAEQPLLCCAVREHFLRCSPYSRVSTSGTCAVLVALHHGDVAGFLMEEQGHPLLPEGFASSAAAKRRSAPHTLCGSPVHQEAEPGSKMSGIPNGVEMCTK